MASVRGPLTPFHMTDKVLLSLFGQECQMLAQDPAAVQIEPESELADVSEGMYGDTETVITRSSLATLTASFKSLSPTLRDVKPNLATETLESGGYAAELVDQNVSSRFHIGSDRAVLMHSINKSRGGRTLNAETIASKGVFLN